MSPSTLVHTAEENRNPDPETQIAACCFNALRHAHPCPEHGDNLRSTNPHTEEF